jgi:prophage maintenance system killer protein
MNKDNLINSTIYQTENGSLEVNVDSKNETIWLTQNQIAMIFDKERSVITKHIKKIFLDKEIDEKSNVQKMHIPNSDKTVAFYNLDIILAVGYRVNSRNAIKFRNWATKVLKEYITKGYSINQDLIQKHYNEFLETVENIKLLSKNNNLLQTTEVIDLIKIFANTWLSLDAYDKDKLVSSGITKKQITCTVNDFERDLQNLKQNLIDKNEATELFAIERQNGNLEGIFGNIMQSFGDVDLYETVEEKASHLLYFMVKNHPFVDGNKRSGAYAFIWFLKQNNILNLSRIIPEVLTTLTLLIAESNPKDKEKVIKIVLQLLI